MENQIQIRCSKTNTPMQHGPCGYHCGRSRPTGILRLFVVCANPTLKKYYTEEIKHWNDHEGFPSVCVESAESSESEDHAMEEEAVVCHKGIDVFIHRGEGEQSQD